MCFEEAAKLAVRMALVLNGGRPYPWGGASTSDHVTDPMELGNVESRKGHQSGRRRFTDEQMEDIRAGRCFVCKKKGCRARNHDRRIRLKKQQKLTVFSLTMQMILQALEKSRNTDWAPREHVDRATETFARGN